MSLMKIFDTAGSGMAAESLRLNTVASNLANADSLSSSADSAYKAKELLFAPTQESDGLSDSQDGEVNNGVRMVGVSESQQPVETHYEPGNPMADENGYVYGSNVNPIDELVNMISASRSYQNNVEVMNTTKQLMIKTIDLGS
ncbi:flagellar basal body rod protein FlgC [Dyella caseinilytica]|uniref:Flagellar basal-body rod protein FlgC n=1 Tax=Dyella caseinilytica TaxID=1849581 RepID=A0ABX7GTT6_9GAMM|nr:flagellar basal body rod protein FlgC [Dyella caseinilytica]QRN53431.1 flagellar basal body rod protein FlgC [Dyella caseinilytica]GFZ86503.1 flagellar basal-body rod protein FlgC [Dyella caseinilytica]